MKKLLAACLALAMSALPLAAQTAGKKISQFPAAQALSPTDIFLIDQLAGAAGLSTRNLALSALQSYIIQGISPIGFSGSASDLTTGILPLGRLSLSGATAGTYGSATTAPVVTVDQYGRVTNISSIAIAIPASQVSGLATVATSGSASDLSTGNLNILRLPAIAGNSALVNLLSGSSTPTAVSLPSCSAANSALTYQTGVGFGCNSSSGSGTVGSGTAGQIAYYPSSGTTVGGETVSGDGTIAAGGALTVTKTNGTTFGTAATQNTGTSGATIPFLNGNNTYSGTSNFTGTTTGTTLAASDSSTKFATTATVDAKIIANTAARSSVRQTVQGGPSSLLPSTSASLSISAQNVASTYAAGSATAPLTVAAALGSNLTGNLDYVTQFTTNPTWSSLPASTTAGALYINAQTGATSSSALLPIYQYGGSISTVSGQFTFDTMNMVGWLGNGTTSVAAPLVAIGEFTTSASAVTSTAVYAYNGRYISPLMTFATPSANTIAHNIGTSFAVTIRDVIVNVTPELGYVAGDEVSTNQMATSGTATNSGVSDTINRIVGMQSIGNNINVENKTSPTVLSAITPGNWKTRIYINRTW